jgi:hypothetical protein
MRFLPDLWAQRFHKDKRGRRAEYFGDAELVVNLNYEGSKGYATERAAFRDRSLVIGDAAADLELPGREKVSVLLELVRGPHIAADDAAVPARARQ